MKPLLAATVTSLDELRYPLLGSPKIDGIRCVVINGVCTSRTLKPIPNEFIRYAFAGQPEMESVDGELTVGETFQHSTSGIMTHTGQPDFTFHIFDRVGNEQYFERLQAIREISHPRVKVLHQEPILNANHAQWQLDKYLEEGHEGMMLRCMEGKYKYGRSTLREQILLKVKPFDFDIATVCGFEERLHNANEATTNALGHTERSSHQENMIPMDTLGALIVVHPRWGEFSIGTGFSDSERAYIWHHKEYYFRKQVNFRYQTIGMKDKPRIPSFKGFI